MSYIDDHEDIVSYVFQQPLIIEKVCAHLKVISSTLVELYYNLCNLRLVIQTESVQIILTYEIKAIVHIAKAYTLFKIERRMFRNHVKHMLLSISHCTCSITKKEQLCVFYDYLIMKRYMLTFLRFKRFRKIVTYKINTLIDEELKNKNQTDVTFLQRMRAYQLHFQNLR